MDLLGYTAAILNAIVSNSYYGMLRMGPGGGGGGGVEYVFAS